jgi:hypothetical protein
MARGPRGHSVSGADQGSGESCATRTGWCAVFVKTRRFAQSAGQAASPRRFPAGGRAGASVVRDHDCLSTRVFSFFISSANISGPAHLRLHLQPWRAVVFLSADNLAGLGAVVNLPSVADERGNARAGTILLGNHGGNRAGAFFRGQRQVDPIHTSGFTPVGALRFVPPACRQRIFPAGFSEPQLGLRFAVADNPVFVRV